MKMRGSASVKITGKAGADDPLHRRSARYALLTVLDTAFSLLVVAPAVVAYWRSVWELMTLYVYPDDSLMSSIVSTLIGIGGHLFFALAQRTLSRQLHPDRNRIAFYVGSRLYTVLFAFVCVNGWRGPWNILDMYTELELATVAVTTVVGVIALAAIRALRNVMAPPYAVVTDYADGYFEVVTMFRVTMVQKTSLYILDCLFSILIVGTLVVFVWRGSWVLLDIYLFPEDETWSAWGSLILGYMFVIIAFLLQPVMRWICDRLGGSMRLVAADAFLLFALVGTVNVWRGIWNLLNLYFLPDDMLLSCWITHWVSLMLLVLLGCSNSLLVRGVYIDAEEPAGKCVLFPCYYLRQIFQQERANKLVMLAEAAASFTGKPAQPDEIATIKRDLEIGDKLAHYTTPPPADKDSVQCVVAERGASSSSTIESNDSSATAVEMPKAAQDATHHDKVTVLKATVAHAQTKTLSNCEEVEVGVPVRCHEAETNHL